jgi:hypothetical protein
MWIMSTVLSAAMRALRWRYNYLCIERKLVPVPLNEMTSITWERFRRLFALNLESLELIT